MGRGQGQTGADLSGGIGDVVDGSQDTEEIGRNIGVPFVNPDGHHGVTDISLGPTALALGDLPGAEEPGSDGLRELGFGEAAGERREIADIHHHD